MTASAGSGASGAGLALSAAVDASADGAVLASAETLGPGETGLRVGTGDVAGEQAPMRSTNRAPSAMARWLLMTRMRSSLSMSVGCGWCRSIGVASRVPNVAHLPPSFAGLGCLRDRDRTP